MQDLSSDSRVRKPRGFRPLVLGSITAFALVVGACGSSSGLGIPPIPPAFLSGLVLSDGVLTPAFDRDVRTYQVEGLAVGTMLTVAATPEDGGATMTINTLPLASGVPTAPYDLKLVPLVLTIDILNPDTGTGSYSITMTQRPTLQDAYAKAFTPGMTDRLGRSVAVDGDTLVVGAAGEDSDATGIDGDETDDSADGAGAVYVYVRVAGVWVREAYVKAPNTNAFDAFGESVDISGDTLVVGAPGEESDADGVGGDQNDNTASGAGAAYVYFRTAGVWALQGYLKASNSDGSDSFGARVAIHADTVVVGAAREDSNATGVNGDESDNSAGESGAAYVFLRTGTTWSQQAYLKASNTGAADRFGTGVDVCGDIVVVGASMEDSAETDVGGTGAGDGAMDSGAAYVFSRAGVVWTQQAYLKASDTAVGDEFGAAVSVSGDTVAVGAFREAHMGDANGAVYVYVRDGAWMPQSTLRAADLGSDWFGVSLSLAGDGNALAVGAHNEDSAATGIDGDQMNDGLGNSGACYYFTRYDGMWTQQCYLKASSPDVGDFFGGSIALSDDYLVGGAINESSNATGIGGDDTNDALSASGAAYLFR